MRYVAGIDGGGTKTRCIIGDDKGHILGDWTVGPSNHQSLGAKKAGEAIREVFLKAVSLAGLSPNQVEYVFLALAGADLPCDLELLYKLCSPIFTPVPFRIVNDTWAAMRSGLKTPWGAVSICGTDGNAAVRHPDGKKAILRSLSYELGNYGGGGDITRMALHHAFRADEGTGPDTLLQTFLPPVLGADDMKDLLTRFYPQRHNLSGLLNQVPPLVFHLANQRDRVCQDILIHMGHVLGEMLAGLIMKLEMEDMEVPVVLGGSVYKGNNPLMIDEFTTVLHRTAPRAYTIIPTLPPVAGAYLSALDELSITPGEEVYQNLEIQFREFGKFGDGS